MSDEDKAKKKPARKQPKPSERTTNQVGITRANKNREIKREELRRYLQERGKVQYIFDNIEKIEDLSGKKSKENIDLDANAISRLRLATDTRVKLLSKYLPDLKQVEIDDSEKANFSDLSDEQLAVRIQELQSAITESGTR